MPWEIKLTILGCGSSQGVPQWHPQMSEGDWGACDPLNPRNRRTRASVHVLVDGVGFLIDTSPDMKEQCIGNRIEKIDAVLYSHAHSDHSHGIDDLRNFYHAHGQKPFDIYGAPEHIDEITNRFSYLMRPTDAEKGHDISVACLIPHRISPGPLEIKGIPLTAFRQVHGIGFSYGYRFGNVAYSTDFNALDQKALKALEGLDCWILDALRMEGTPPSHNNLEQALAFIELIKPKRAILTHMNRTMDEAHLREILPPHIVPAYDGMVVSITS